MRYNNYIKYIKYAFFCLFLIVYLIAIFKSYIKYCKNCVQSCVFFSYINVNKCIEMCGCPNLSLNVNPSVPDYSKYDKKLDEYDPAIQLKKQLNRKISKPNIVMIILDDADKKISPFFDAMPFAKELFKLNGTDFTNAFTSTSYCCPARCQIFTGEYGHNNGVTSMYGNFASINAFRMPLHSNGTRQKNHRTNKLINNEFRTLNLHLQNIGYTTHAIGKYINGIENDERMQINYVPPGWNTFNVGADHFIYSGYRYTLTDWKKGDNLIKYKWYGTSEKDYVTDVISDFATNIVKNYTENPFFLYIAPTAPHLPLPPAKRHYNKISYWESQYDKYVSNRPNYNANLKNKPHWLKKTEAERNNFHDMDIRWNKLDWTRRMTSMYAIDELIHNVYKEIDKQGKLNNTIFILGSDNGYNLFAHKQINKMSANDESMSVMLYASGFPFEKNKTDDQLALLIDLAPTLYDIIGYKKPYYVDGYSLFTKKKRSSILFQYKNKNFHDENDNLHNSPELLNLKNIVPKQMLFDVPPFTGIRTFNHVLIEYYNTSENNSNEHELYDLVKDPYQLENVYEHHSYDTIKENLQTRLDKLQVCSGENCVYI